ncbi:nitrogen permease regulator 2-domain-containing protein [Mycena amicta]|nr:nitrogen permease regulator 2-domain-containing protein [Mycena amicta]
MPEGHSFLPRIQSVFYSVFDVSFGPKVVYQVPEGLIATGNAPPSDTQPSTSSVISPTRNIHSPQKRPPPLFSFDDISKYVIPQSQLCGRLVACSTKRHRIMGFPVQLSGPKYQRNYLRYNLCFVFERGADLSCYEPIVRKVSRVLTACEEESEFLSSPTTSPAIHAILEQLYEDLNSYSETSIPIDRFNSIELKIFPFYPNPPQVQDWMVPLALINLSKRIEDNWDLTMVKVCRYIDGVNHISRIAHLADCDRALTRLAISHLLYYQVIMTIDIFQYSNMYTLRASIQSLANEADVKEECAAYVTRPGHSRSDWPKLLHLYSRLKQGKTVFEWMQTHEIQSLGIDVRRFVSFGVIKGFLRRVHRWPVLLPPEPAAPNLNKFGASSIPQARTRMNSLSAYSPSPPAPFIELSSTPNLLRGRTPQNTPIMPSLSPDLVSPSPVSPRATTSAIGTPVRTRRPSAAEKILEQLRSRDVQKSGPSARASWIYYTNESEIATAPATVPHEAPSAMPRTGGSESRRQSLSALPINPPPSPVLTKATISTAAVAPLRPQSTVSPSVPARNTEGWSNIPYPKDLPALLDGEHHTDELAVQFEAGWPLLEQWLAAIDGGDLGRVVIIYR